MKNSKTLSLGILGLLVLQLALSACEKSKDREETIDQEIKEKLVQISDLHDISSDSTMAYFYRENEDGEISLADKTPQIKTNETVARVLGMIGKEEDKKVLESQISSGLIAFAIMTDQVKIYKVMTKAKASAEYETMSLLDIRKAKRASLENGQMTMAAAQTDITESKGDIQYVEIASLTISKSGVLGNKRTKHYDEKTSILTVDERPLQVSTHLILEPQKTSTEETSPN